MKTVKELTKILQEAGNQYNARMSLEIEKAESVKNAQAKMASLINQDRWQDVQVGAGMYMRRGQVVPHRFQSSVAITTSKSQSISTRKIAFGLRTGVPGAALLHSISLAVLAVSVLLSLWLRL